MNRWSQIAAVTAVAVSAVSTPSYAGFFDGMNLGGTFSTLSGVKQSAYSRKLSAVAQNLAAQLKANQKESRGPESTVVVASIVSLENPDETNRIGLALSNSLTHALQVRDYRAIDFHLRKALQVTQGGDFVTSNQVNQLRNSFDITYMVTGTLSEHSDGLIITMRMVDWETGVVVSTAESHLTTVEYFGLMSDMEINRPVVKVIRRNVPQPTQRVMKIRPAYKKQ
ncbi:MAG: hypothetical protein HOL17_12835 [Gammaproteobacteria bacterium]|jgi:TolB-like protein|nr:hypothetical protein [Gammaproteobacteria bacterium]